MKKTVHEKNYEIWSGLSETYHDSRPLPPAFIVKIILSWLQKEPDTVVDVGCGTGLSTLIWDRIAKRIVGIEPNDEMRAIAEKIACSDSIVYKRGVSNETNLPSDYTDVITVSQAFHWMDIDSTLVEFYRILKKNGILAIYDFALPPVIGWEIEKAFIELRTKCSEIVYSQETSPVHNDKNTYNDRIKSFGKFRYSREAVLHNAEKWTQEKLMDFIVNISNADFAVKIDTAIKEDVDEFCALIKAKCSGEIEIIFPYKAVIAVK